MCDSYEARLKELAMQGFSRLFPRREDTEPPQTVPIRIP